MAKTSIQSQLTTFWAGLFFILGKIFRFLFLFLFLFSVLFQSQTLAGYNKNQVILFFLVFNLIDVTVQFFFRGVYFFRHSVVRGDFDLDLLKPYPSFFRPLFGWTDIFDFITLIPLWLYFMGHVFTNQLFPSSFQLFIFGLFFLNSLFLAFSFHLFICSICVLTTEIDHLILIYRDLTGMARVPTDIYDQGIRFILTFTIPVIVLITVPVKALMGILSWQGAVLSIIISGVFFLGSIKFWQYSLARYTSASS